MIEFDKALAQLDNLINNQTFIQVFFEVLESQRILTAKEM